MATSRSRKTPHDTPMMRQYLSIKEQYPDAILMYRMGDFYEMFFEDAVIAAEALDLALTSRNKNDPDPIPMCGVPHHAAVGYVARLIEQGHKVAICEQMEDPAKVKGLVKREVVRVITPGVVIDEENLEAKANNFLCAVFQEDHAVAIASLDASTGEFKATQVPGVTAALGELFRIEPKELLVPPSLHDAADAMARSLEHCCITKADAALFAASGMQDVLGEAVGSQDAEILVRDAPLQARCAAAALRYYASTRPHEALPPMRLVCYDLSGHMIVDETTKRHLELVTTATGEKKGSLLWLLDQTRTAMGGRLLRRRMHYPLCDKDAVARRLSQVELFYDHDDFREAMRAALAQVADVERIAARIRMGAIKPRDLGVLRDSLAQLQEINVLLDSCPAPDADALLGGPIDPLDDVYAYLAAALVADPPADPGQGGIFADGFHPELDELRKVATGAKDFIADLETRERQRTGIGSLKIAYNKVFGYYILVTKPNLHAVPDDYIRKQTVANGERFVTPELQEWESKYLTAEEKQRALERHLFEEMTASLLPHCDRLLASCDRVAQLDCAAALAHVARHNDYVKPTLNERAVIHIEEGRHPLVETLFRDVPFVPNDVHLDNDTQRLIIITGPNMAGKSTVMRQVALLCIMAQMGSFVPAAKADLCMVDRVFTRVGASDNIAKGVSTFMVEMQETAQILKGATADSLVILDEVGRGTSTFDGLSIAWSVGEYLHDVVGCKTLFATHYHELVELADTKPCAANFHVAAKEYRDQVVFLRKLVPGGTSHSFGIQVAKMAGLPELVLARAKEILATLEKESGSLRPLPDPVVQTPQMDLFTPKPHREMVRILSEVDINRLTPVEALALLDRLQKMAGGAP